MFYICYSSLQTWTSFSLSKGEPVQKKQVTEVFLIHVHFHLPKRWHLYAVFLMLKKNIQEEEQKTSNQHFLHFQFFSPINSLPHNPDF